MLVKELKEEIEETLNGEREKMSRMVELYPDYANDNLIGWIEALEYVLGLME